MTKCSDSCIPCCDNCVYAIYDKIMFDNKIIKGGPIGCAFHTNEDYKRITNGCGFCDDFFCKNINKK